MITVENVSKTYDRNNEVLKNINIQFPDKGLVVICGESGCGKSTFLNILSGMDIPTSGNICIDGININAIDQVTWDVIRTEKLGFVFQDFNLLEDFSVRDNISLPLKMIGLDDNEVDKKIKGIADDFGITDLLDKNTNKLSGGEKQRVAVARAVLKNPDILLADEPTGNLDEKNSILIFELLKKISLNRLVIVVTHDKSMAEKYADRIVTLHYGVIENDNCINFSDHIKNKIDLNGTGKNRIPTRTMFSMAKKTLKKRMVRTVVTVFILAVTMTFALLFTSIKTCVKSKSIEKYLSNKSVDYFQLYQTIEQNYEGIAGDVISTIHSGKKLLNRINSCVDNKFVYYVSNNHFVSCEKDLDNPMMTNIMGIDNSIFEYYGFSGNQPDNTDEIIVGSELANKLNIDRADLPVDMVIGSKKTRVTGILNPIPTSGLAEENANMNCFIKKENMMNFFAGFNSYCKGVNYITVNGLRETAMSQAIIGDISSYHELIVGRTPTKKDEIVVSNEFLESFGINYNEVVDKTYTLHNLYAKKYGNVFYGTINLYDFCGDTIKVVGISDYGAEIIFAEDVYNSLLSEKIYTEIDYGVFVKDSMSDIINSVTKNNLKIDGYGLNEAYNVWASIDSLSIAMYIILAVGIIFSFAQMISLFTFSIKDNYKIIGILKSLGTPQGQINILFMIESFIATIIAFVIAVAGTVSLVAVINNYCITNLLDKVNIQLIVIHKGWIIFAALAAFAMSVSVVLFPLRKASKIAIVDLIRNT